MSSLLEKAVEIDVDREIPGPPLILDNLDEAQFPIRRIPPEIVSTIFYHAFRDSPWDFSSWSINLYFANILLLTIRRGPVFASVQSESGEDADSKQGQIQTLSVGDQPTTAGKTKKARRAGTRNHVLVRIKTVTIASILLMSSNQKCNALQSVMGLFCHSTNAPELLIETLAHSGLSISTIEHECGVVTKALTVGKSPAQRKPLYHDAVLTERPLPLLKEGEILVRIGAAAFNHRDVWIRKGQYPRIAFGAVFGADGAGTVVAAHESNDALLNRRVFLTPSRGWEKHPEAPESNFGILGGVSYPPLGTFSEYVVVERDQVILTPEHLDDVQIAAWPLGGVTAWRAAVVNGLVRAGQTVLVTGIGGGVALIALQICIARGATVYVTSGNPEKIRKAVALGAKGGVNYKDKDWPDQLGILLSREKNGSRELDLIIDSGGGEIMAQTGKILKQGGRVVCYGMTANPKVSFTMREVLKNQRLIGSTMGSHQDLIDATNFMAEHRIVPVISHVCAGLESAEEGFEIMKRGDQFGKIVIRMRPEGSRRDSPEAKL
ncbi:putative zinc-binding dehydrogenase [Lyophyllum shimeji]|uniref:Zinc-binding dehydrogenase n=1 Tax=Lyophyllum shimeji TaxID=47721 RepID=A0A9P3PEM1_LYOSH|nr:putative zinc-binding dehydrogenase [Lyophyllum shimeji]